jgi:hypothetical protein
MQAPFFYPFFVSVDVNHPHPLLPVRKSTVIKNKGLTDFSNHPYLVWVFKTHQTMPAAQYLNGRARWRYWGSVISDQFTIQ